MHDFYLVCIGHFDINNQRFILPLKIYSSLSSAKRFVEKKRSRDDLRWNDLDSFFIYKFNFDQGDFFQCCYISINGVPWVKRGLS